MNSFLRNSSLGLALAACVSALPAAPKTPAVGTNERKEIMDALRMLRAVEAHAATARAPIIFKVHALMVDGDNAIAEVTPATEGFSRSFPRQLAFLHRGGDEPWGVVRSGDPVDASWATRFVADGNSQFRNLWNAYRGSAPSPEGTMNADQPIVTVLKEGDPDRAAILKIVRAQPLIAAMSKELGKEIILGKIDLKKGGDWAWIKANPRVADGSWQGEPLIHLLRKRGGNWQIADGIPDTVLSADEPDAAYTTWRANLLKKNPTLPAGLVPLQ